MYVLTLLDPSEGTTSGFSMKAASDDARLLKKVAANHRQPLTSKPRSPDWTRDVWLLIFAFTLFSFALRSTAFAFPLFSFASRYPSHRLFPSHVPFSLFLFVNLPSHHSLIKLFHRPPRSSLSALHLFPSPGHRLTSPLPPTIT